MLLPPDDPLVPIEDSESFASPVCWNYKR